MSRRMGSFLCTALMVMGSSGCGLLCDRYCERQHDRCDRLQQNRGCAPMTGCYSPPVNNNCYPAPGVYSAQPQPAPYCP